MACSTYPLIQHCKMTDVLKTRSECIFNGEHVYQRLIDAGFVDVQVIKKTIDVGNWRDDGMRPGFSSDKIDPALRHARHMALVIFSGIAEPVSFRFHEWFPDENDRREWGRKVVEEMHSGKDHLVTTM